MNLRITNANNFFTVKGTLTKRNVHIFKAEFNEAFKQFDSLTLSIEGLENVDRRGVKAIADLHLQSLKNNVKLSIVGSGCRALYDHFKSCEAA
ncbi:hypothetical protein MHTCC0001_32720 [Flavobacteriaceae bacterium MHTCC 0001]